MSDLSLGLKVTLTIPYGVEDFAAERAVQRIFNVAVTQLLNQLGTSGYNVRTVEAGCGLVVVWPLGQNEKLSR